MVKNTSVQGVQANKMPYIYEKMGHKKHKLVLMSRIGSDLRCSTGS